LEGRLDVFYDENLGASYSSWSAFILFLGSFFMLYLLWQFLKAPFENRAHAKVMNLPSPNLFSEIVVSLVFWIFLWIPLGLLAWLVGKLGF